MEQPVFDITTISTTPTISTHAYIGAVLVVIVCILLAKLCKRGGIDTPPLTVTDADGAAFTIPPVVKK